jgi:hypothetical protein
MLLEKLPWLERVFWRFADRAFGRRGSALIYVAAAQAYPVMQALLRRRLLRVLFGRFNGRRFRHELPWIEYPFRRAANRAFLRGSGSLVNKTAAHTYPVFETLLCHRRFYTLYLSIILPAQSLRELIINDGISIPPIAKKIPRLFGTPV